MAAIIDCMKEMYYKGHQQRTESRYRNDPSSILIIVLGVWMEHLIHFHLNCDAGMLQITVVGSMCTL